MRTACVVEVILDTKQLKEEISKRVTNAAEEALDISSNFMLTQLDKGFEEEGERNSETAKWKGVSIKALVNRVTFPRRASPDEQTTWIRSKLNTTLQDTGKMRKSVSILDRIKKGLGFKYFIGASDKKIATHELGGEIKGHEVPPRPNQFITDSEIRKIESIFEETFKQL